MSLQLYIGHFPKKDSRAVATHYTEHFSYAVTNPLVPVTYKIITCFRNRAVESDDFQGSGVKLVFYAHLR